MRWIVAGLALCAAEPAIGEPILEEDFSSPAALDDWREFKQGSVANVSVTADGHLLGERSDAGGLVAKSRYIDPPRQRLMIEFSLAVSEGRGRVFHMWSQQPGGRDASQLNLCVQGGELQFFDGRTRTWQTVPGAGIEASVNRSKPVWNRVVAVFDQHRDAVHIWIGKPGELEFGGRGIVKVAAYRTELPLGGISFVSGTRIAEDAWYLIDDLKIEDGSDIADPGMMPPLPKPFELWSGDDLPADPVAIPFADGIEHSVIHRPGDEDYKFLHGAAIVEHQDVFYANWANSPIDENGAHETLRGKRSTDGGKTWSALEIIGPGFDGKDRHSHGVLFSHAGEMWTICARFGIGAAGKKFTGLKAEAFVLDPEIDRWMSRGIVMENCWPYDPPTEMGDGNFIVGGQDKDGLPVVAISQGDNFEKMWRSVLIPFPPELKPSFAETTVWADGDDVLAVIRGGGGSAWVSTSKNSGVTWSQAQPSNLPMPRAKAFLGRLDNGQWFLVSNYRNRDTLVVSTGKPGENSLSKMWRLRHGKSEAPRFPGHAKSKQWSYPYAYEHDGSLYVVYSIGKEECGLTVVPVSSLAHR